MGRLWDGSSTWDLCCLLEREGWKHIRAGAGQQGQTDSVHQELHHSQRGMIRYLRLLCVHLRWVGPKMGPAGHRIHPWYLGGVRGGGLWQWREGVLALKRQCYEHFVAHWKAEEPLTFKNKPLHFKQNPAHLHYLRNYNAFRLQFWANCLGPPLQLL